MDDDTAELMERVDRIEERCDALDVTLGLAARLCSSIEATLDRCTRA